MIIIIKFLSQSRVRYVALYDKSTNVELYAIAAAASFTVHQIYRFVCDRRLVMSRISALFTRFTRLHLAEQKKNMKRANNVGPHN